jgi:hypothetical protein
MITNKKRTTLKTTQIQCRKIEKDESPNKLTTCKLIAINGKMSTKVTRIFILPDL